MADAKLSPDIAGLPYEIQRKCVVPFSVGCAMASISRRQADHLIAEGKFPAPVRMGERHRGFILGEVLDAIERARAER